MRKIPKKAKKSTKNEVYHFPLRLKQTTAKEVKERADSMGRSFNRQVEFELSQKP